MTRDRKRSRQYADAIRASGLSIYDPIQPNDPKLWIPPWALEVLLNETLVGASLSGLPLRTRSRIVKGLVCKALGYPVLLCFRRTKPKFPGQSLDVYTQKANNLQIWNEELSPTRRYALIAVSAEGVITRAKVVSGEILARFVTTGTLTQKYQARLVPGKTDRELVTKIDTDVILPLTGRLARVSPGRSAIDWPQSGELLPISCVFDILASLIGMTFDDTGYDQDRNRGALLHEIVCRHLGYAEFRDVGQFPDIRHQLLEVKLQTSPTIDLGLVCPDCTDGTGLPMIAGRQVRHCDMRYAMFYGRTDGLRVSLEKLFVVVGRDFFKRFPRFEGRVVNKKLQIRLPSDFFEA
jgi:hypothetical protein